MVVTILTGMRPRLLETMLDSVIENAPGLLEEAFVSVHHNTGDRGTRDVLSRIRVDERNETDELLSIGKSTSHLALRAWRVREKRPWWLHIEDDWRMIPSTERWLEDAKAILLWGGDVAEVRLRHVSEPVTGTHRVTHERLSQEDFGWWRLMRWHPTFTPALRRSEVARKMFPCQTELDMQHRAFENGLTRVAQLVPGNFVHTGQAHSLRETVGRQ